ncbi:Flippase kinase 1 [Porphyridium purpureum]|uniref:non-specific serine/threonine protein kinase n=1 Tax=Porphyridium purpureum TaxID=35688 RepID=A0A5J4YY78_PORPP|nr:Flippase kinase 1 [Porphyridium purpureum]|eukprot:POR8700..scf209_3
MAALSSLESLKEEKSLAYSASVPGSGSPSPEHVFAVSASEDFPLKASEIKPSRFSKLRVLGQGAIGTVYLCVLNGFSPTKVYAVKEISMDDAQRKGRHEIHTRVLTEREIMASSTHPCIITFYASFQTKHAFYSVMDYAAGGEFFRILRKQKHNRIPEKAARFYAAEVLLALEFLHSCGFLYRDLKPENIMMKASGHLALTDFDLGKVGAAHECRVVMSKETWQEKVIQIVSGKHAKAIDRMTVVDSEPTTLTKTTSFVGTEEYLAPEVVLHEQQSGAVDWWTFGVLLYEMVVGYSPFSKEAAKSAKNFSVRDRILHRDVIGEKYVKAHEKRKASNSESVLNNVLHASLHFPPDVHVSKQMEDLVFSLLRKDPMHRLGYKNGASDIKAHPWFQGLNFNLILNETAPIKPMLKHDPTDLSQYKNIVPLAEDSEFDMDTAETADMVSGVDVLHGFGFHDTHLDEKAMKELEDRMDALGPGADFTENDDDTPQAPASDSVSSASGGARVQ